MKKKENKIAGEELNTNDLVYEKDGKYYAVRCEKCQKKLKWCRCKV